MRVLKTIPYVSAIVSLAIFTASSVYPIEILGQARDSGTPRMPRKYLFEPARDNAFSMTINRYGIAATLQTLDSQATSILARGGSAVDAAIAANAVLGHPFSTTTNNEL